MSGKSTKKGGMGKKSPRPLKWLRDATVEEIGEAMLLDPVKGMMVATYVQARSGVEIGSRIELAVDRAKANPGKVARSVVQALFRE